MPRATIRVHTQDAQDTFLSRRILSMSSLQGASWNMPAKLYSSTGALLLSYKPIHLALSRLSLISIFSVLLMQAWMCMGDCCRGSVYVVYHVPALSSSWVYNLPAIWRWWVKINYLHCHLLSPLFTLASVQAMLCRHLYCLSSVVLAYVHISKHINMVFVCMYVYSVCDFRYSVNL